MLEDISTLFVLHERLCMIIDGMLQPNYFTVATTQVHRPTPLHLGRACTSRNSRSSAVPPSVARFCACAEITSSLRKVCWLAVSICSKAVLVGPTSVLNNSTVCSGQEALHRTLPGESVVLDPNRTATT